MNSGVTGQLTNYRYWQTLRSVGTEHKEKMPSKEGGLLMLIFYKKTMEVSKSTSPRRYLKFLIHMKRGSTYSLK